MVGMFKAYNIDQIPWEGLARRARRVVVSLNDANNVVAALQCERIGIMSREAKYAAEGR